MEYFIKFSAILGLFFIFYKLFLEKETFFNMIRGYFLIGIITALILPLIIIPEYVYLENVWVSQMTASSVEVAAVENSPGLDLETLILGVYALGVLFFGIRFLLQLGSLLRFILKYQKTKRNGYVFIEADASTSPFSFFNYIIYPKDGFSDAELDQIIAHEKVHASQFHSFDILLGQLLIIFNWVNPLSWMYHKEVQKNLEFIADEKAHSIHNNKESYQYLLLKTVTPNYSLALTSNFYNSLIKKRIKMLHKDKSNNMMYFKFIFIIPVLIAFVFTFNTKVIAQQKTEEKVEWRTELEVEVITKDFQKSDLEALKSNLLKKGITLGYKKLKYNDNKEIVAIQISVSNKQNNKTQLEQMGSAPIKPISIKFDDKGALAVGNLEGMEEHNVFVKSAHKDGEENVFVVKSANGSKKSDGNYVWVSNNGDETHVKIVNGQKVTEEIHGPHSKNVWVSESGDSTKVRTVQIIEVDEMQDGEKTVIVKKIHKDSEDVDIIVETSGDVHKSENKMMFISDDGEQPLMIVDGKEMENGSLEDIDPKTIETINVYKGEMAVEKYGEKAKDGVVVIKTKK
ncbi:M56 family metallopeptidase [Lutimonas halocynthiae]|uniref:M56 family metallopeptidase n=1 Tax=Lutimonas halocynthiae TaxID=1446477 RepID=UPI0025B429F1|nr:M56 family metallopeptidase [Lutimonas halocynthiae]MDN3641858.1 M56 family metallopeptidase [Lutimonas halocynthiae]